MDSIKETFRGISWPALLICYHPIQFSEDSLWICSQLWAWRVLKQGDFKGLITTALHFNDHNNMIFKGFYFNWSPFKNATILGGHFLWVRPITCNPGSENKVINRKYTSLCWWIILTRSSARMVLYWMRPLNKLTLLILSV